jgi:hypothetical protein
MSERTGLPECRNRAHHDFGVERLHVLIVESHVADGTGRIILDQHIAAAYQTLDDVVTLGSFDVDANRLLAAIVLHEVSAAPFLTEERSAARRIAVGGQLDLDHLGAHLRHHQGAGWARHHLREIENLVAVENVLRSWHIGASQARRIAVRVFYSTESKICEGQRGRFKRYAC